MLDRTAFALACFVGLTACGSLTPEELTAVRKMQVRTVSPEARCQNLGEVSGSQTSESTGGMRAQAVKLGGNTLRIDANGGGTVFYCPIFAVKTPDADPVLTPAAAQP